MLIISFWLLLLDNFSSRKKFDLATVKRIGKIRVFVVVVVPVVEING